MFILQQWKVDTFFQQTLCSCYTGILYKVLNYFVGNSCDFQTKKILSTDLLDLQQRIERRGRGESHWDKGLP